MKITTTLLLFSALMLAACGSDDDPAEDETTDAPVVLDSPAEDATPAPEPTPDPAEEAGIEMTTVGALDLALPVAVPADIPAPLDAAYIGESTTAAPYRAVQFATDMDPDELTAELRAFAEGIDANFDEAIGQVTYQTDLDGSRWAVYAWVRTNEGQTILEIGTIAVE